MLAKRGDIRPRTPAVRAVGDPLAAHHGPRPGPAPAVAALGFFVVTLDALVVTSRR